MHKELYEKGMETRRKVLGEKQGWPASNTSTRIAVEVFRERGLIDA